MADASARADERKLATMPFADLAGSTKRVGPARSGAPPIAPASYFSAVAEAIESWGGTVQMYIGDAIMAVFGVPVIR
jgi:class 3 adenylate cyclase